MLGPLARTRALLSAAVLGTAAVGSVLLASGSSATAPASPPRMGPFAAPPPVQPLLRTDGPLLPQEVTRPVSLPATRTAVPPGPRSLAARVVGPSAVVVGPDSPPHEIRAVQRLLNRAGAGLRVDGAWGPATSAAVRAVQARAGLPTDGRVGAATAAVLHSAVAH